MNNLEHNYTEEEIKPYIKYGEKIERTSLNDLILIKWFEDFLLDNNLIENKELIGVLGSLIFFQYDNDKIKNREDFKIEIDKILNFYNENLYTIQNEYPFRLLSTLKNLLIIRKFKLLNYHE